MITVLTEPQNTPVNAIESDDPKGVPVPVSDCFTWCLQLDDADAVTTAGSNAVVIATFPLSTIVVSPGTEFKIWGYDFTINNSIAFTSSSFRTTTSGKTTSENFLNMIRGNLFFARATRQTITFNGSAYTVTVTWNECREQPNFTVAAMDLAAIEDAGATVGYENGTLPVYVDGVKVVTQLIYNNDLNTPLPVSEFEGHEVDRLCDSVAPVCIDYRIDIEGQLHTILPELSIDSFTSIEDNAQSLMKVFQLNYGFIYRENCIAKSGTFMRSAYVVGINAAFPINDPYGMRRYWFNHPDGYPAGQSLQKFLTSQPSGIRICKDSYSWLWLTNNFSETFGEDYKLAATFTVYFEGEIEAADNVVIMDSQTDPNRWFYPICFNTSPGHIEDITGVTVYDYYTVRVIITDLDDDPIASVTEILKYVPIKCDCSKATDVYFLTPQGGYSTLLVDIVSQSVTREGTEVNLYVPCGWDFDTKNKQGGRTLVNLRNYETRTIRASALSNNKENIDWFQDFILSPVKFIKEVNGDVEFARKIIVDPGTVQINTLGEFAELTATIYLSDISVQNPANQ